MDENTNRTIVIQKAFKAEKEFDKFLWTLKVRSTDKTRKPLMGIYIHNGWAVCTDGHRLHMFKLELRNIEPGLYFVPEGGCNKKMITLQPDTDGFEFPDYERVIPTAEPDQWITFPVVDDDSFFVYAACQLASFNLTYLRDAFIPNRTLTLNGYTKNKRLPILEVIEHDVTLDAETKKEVKTIVSRAIVMPLALKENEYGWQRREPEPEAIPEPEPLPEPSKPIGPPIELRQEPPAEPITEPTT